jgi:hypothetical protein
MTLLGATEGSETESEMLRGLKYRQSHSKREITERYRQFERKLSQNDNLKIGKNLNYYLFLFQIEKSLKREILV